MNLKTKLIAFGACAIVAGCSVLSPQPDRSEFFILTPVSDSAGMAARPASTSPDSQLTIGVGPVDFPDYLRRLPVVTRVAPNRIDLSEERRWAEPLDKNFVRVLSENLATLLDTQQDREISLVTENQGRLPDRNQRPTVRDHQRRPDTTARELDHQRGPAQQNPLRITDYGWMRPQAPMELASRRR